MSFLRKTLFPTKCRGAEQTLLNVVVFCPFGRKRGSALQESCRSYRRQFQMVAKIMGVHSIEGGFTPKECDKIVIATSAAPAREALLVGQNRDHNLRLSDLVWLDEVEGMGWVMDRLIDVVRISNRDRFDFDLREFAESPQVATYEATERGHFKWHFDIGDGPVARKRKLTLVAQLSIPGTYDGGDLEVMPGAHIVGASRAQGCVTIFPSFHLHHVTPVTRGTRHSLTVWAHGPAFR
jgi:PKHD-type hydroxylase